MDDFDELDSLHPNIAKIVQEIEQALSSPDPTFLRKIMIKEFRGRLREIEKVALEGPRTTQDARLIKSILCFFISELVNPQYGEEQQPSISVFCTDPVEKWRKVKEETQ